MVFISNYNPLLLGISQISKVPKLLVIGLGVEVQAEIDHASDEPLTHIHWHIIVKGLLEHSKISFLTSLAASHSLTNTIYLYVWILYVPFKLQSSRTCPCGCVTPSTGDEPHAGPLCVWSFVILIFPVDTGITTLDNFMF